MKTLLLSSLIVASLAGCASHPYVKTPAFSPEEHVNYIIDNGSALRGESVYRDSNGDNISCADQNIYLLPDTEFYQHLMAIDNSGYFLRNKIDPRARDLIRSARCDSHGRFVFERLPQAKWIAVSPLHWNYSDEKINTKTPKPHQVVLVKQVRSLAQRSDEVFLLESDAVYDVPAYAADRLINRPDPTPVVVKGGECVADNLGKEDVLPSFCVEKEEIIMERMVVDGWKIQGDK